MITSELAEVVAGDGLGDFVIALQKTDKLLDGVEFVLLAQDEVLAPEGVVVHRTPFKDAKRELLLELLEGARAVAERGT
jgi:hypothetical protein